jgi:SAM-dependent methyltransferase
MATIVAYPVPNAAKAYDVLAEAYDALTADYCHGDWLRRIEELVRARGLRGRRALDLACGTGKSFLPLIDLGYEVTACDVSPRMVDIARHKAPGANITVQDMRDLGRRGEFDLITCLDDAINYLLTENELRATFAGMAANLAPRGFAVFDVNTLRMYSEGFARDWICDDPGAFVAWAGGDATSVVPGAQVEATVHLFLPDGDRWRRRTSHHHQHHWPRGAIERTAQDAGLSIETVRGQRRGAILEPGVDELTHTKALYVLTRREEVSLMRIGGP